MKSHRIVSKSAAALLLGALASLSSQAATLYWDVNGTATGLGGTGTWDTSTANWASLSNGTSATSVWPNNTTTPDTAEFRGIGGTVTLSGSGLTTTHLVTDVTSGAYTFGGSALTVTATTGAGTTGAFYALNGKGSSNITINNNIVLNKSVVTGDQAFVFATTAANVVTINGNVSFAANGSSTGAKAVSLRASGANSTIYFNGVVGAGPGGTAITRLQIFGNSNSSTYISGNNTGLGDSQVVSGNAYLQNDLAVGTGTIQLSNSGTASGARAALLTDGARVIANNISIGKSGDATTELVIGGSSAHVSSYTGSVSISGSTAAVANLRFSAVSGGRVNFSNVISGAGTASQFIKQGAGVVAFTRGAGNTYVGSTFVNEGALVLGNTTGSATGTGAVTVANAATLAGTGIATGAVTASAADSIFSPGDLTKDGVSSLGTLTLSGGLTAASGATFNFDLNGGSADKINFVGGTLDLDGTVTFNFTSLGSIDTGTPYNLFAGTGAANWNSISASFVFNAPAGYTLDSSYGTGGYLLDPTNHVLNVQFAAIPEPSSFAAIAGLGVLGAVALRRRRRA